MHTDSGWMKSHVTAHTVHNMLRTAVLGKFSQSMAIFIEQLYIFGRFAFYGITRGEQLRTMITLCGFVCVSQRSQSQLIASPFAISFGQSFWTHHRRPLFRLYVACRWITSSSLCETGSLLKNNRSLNLRLLRL